MQFSAGVAEPSPAQPCRHPSASTRPEVARVEEEAGGGEVPNATAGGKKAEGRRTAGVFRNTSYAHQQSDGAGSPGKEMQPGAQQQSANQERNISGLVRVPPPLRRRPGCALAARVGLYVSSTYPPASTVG